MVSRRNFLKGSLGIAGILTLEGCFPYLGGFFAEETKKYYTVEKKLRDEKLTLNTGTRLRRYNGKKGDPYTRESELIILARTELKEEGFGYIEPENIWYELGIAEKSTRVTSIADLIIGYAGKGSIPFINKFTIYHYHPALETAKVILNYGKLKYPDFPMKDLIKLAYKKSKRHWPPSNQDFLAEKLCKELSTNKGITLVQRVADYAGIWEYGFNEKFRLNLNKEKLENVQQARKEAMWLALRSKENGTPKQFIKQLKIQLRKKKIPENALEIKYRQLKDPSSWTLEEFQHTLNIKNIL